MTKTALLWSGSGIPSSKISLLSNITSSLQSTKEARELRDKMFLMEYLVTSCYKKYIKDIHWASQHDKNNKCSLFGTYLFGNIFSKALVFLDL